MKQWRKYLTAVLAVTVGFSTVSMAAGFKLNPKRGGAGEYDPGPAKDSLWVPLFGSVINYRGYSKDILGDEKFRWNMGPMWYRGRLGENKVKMLVVGQEGAQDENTSNRTFTGGTGTKTQNMLEALGFDRSYVFLNTFVYTIFGQRILAPGDGNTANDVKKYMFMEQDPESYIVRYRHQLMDYSAQYNADTLSMMVGVGGGGKESLVTWIESRGGKCKGKKVNECDTTDMEINVQAFGNNSQSGAPVSVVPGVKYLKKTVKLKNKTLVIGVPHPGMAKFPGGAVAVKRGFDAATKRILAFMGKNSTWLSGKRGVPGPDVKGGRDGIVKRLKVFTYKNSPVPYRDFAFGTMARLGDGGTNSNRMGQDSIQVYGNRSGYGNKNVRYDRSQLGKERNVDDNYGLPWEPPRWDPKKPDNAKQFDNGPCAGTANSCKVSKLMMSWPDFSKLRSTPKPINLATFGFGPNYRGNPRNPSLVILADQFSHDDLFTARALSGGVGQRLQTYLDQQGYSNSDKDKKNDYVILRTLPVDTLGMSKADVLKMATNSKVKKARNKILNAVIGDKSVYLMTLGPVAKEVIKTTDYEVDSENALDVSDLPKEMTAIDRADLPYSTRFFMGTTGNRALRGQTDEGAYYRFFAPRWVKETKAPRWKTINN